MPAPATRVAPWEDFVLRVIAIWKLSHAAFFTAVGFGLLKLRHHNIVEILNETIIIPFHLNSDHLNPEGRFVDWMLDQAQKVTPHTLNLLGWAAFFYAALFFLEGFGLYLRKHWAEYVVILVTGSLLPIELYELLHKYAWWKLAAVLGNILIVASLIHRLILDARFKKLQRECEARAAAGTAATPSATGARGKSVVNEVP